MNIAFEVPDIIVAMPSVQPFVLFRDHIRPVLEAGRADLHAMYAAVMGRPELDPVLLCGITLLQIMERLPDRQAVLACLFDARWRLAVNIPCDWKGLDPSTLVHFRARLAKHGKGSLLLNAGLTAMRDAGYLRTRGPVRIDSTHVLADLANLSRLACVRETLRLALDFLSGRKGSPEWEPWATRYAESNPKELRNASVDRLRSAMAQAGVDIRDILIKARALAPDSILTGPLALLQRVLEEQFEQEEDSGPVQREVAPPGAVQNPHDPEAQWSTKGALGKAGWVGTKVQICETAPEVKRAKGEPTQAVITAVVTQPAITSDHGSLGAVLAVHECSGQFKPDEVFADAGYISAPALEKAQGDGYTLCGPIGAPPYSSRRFGSDSFAIDIPNRTATCPSGKTSCECSRIAEAALAGGAYYYFAWAQADCANCPLASQCISLKKRQPFRTLQVGDKHMLVQERRSLCKTTEYQERMRRRCGIEGTNSECKRGYGMKRARYRGLAKTDVQMQITGAAVNLRRWAARRCWLKAQNAAKVA